MSGNRKTFRLCAPATIRRSSMDGLLRLKRAVALVFAAAPRLARRSIRSLAAEAFLPLANLLVLRAVVDKLASTGRGRELAAVAGAVAPLVAIGALVIVATTLLRALSSYTTEALALEVTEHVQARIHEKSIAL